LASIFLSPGFLTLRKYDILFARNVNGQSEKGRQKTVEKAVEVGGALRLRGEAEEDEGSWILDSGCSLNARKEVRIQKTGGRSD
jgi:hypothetical protein